MERDTFDRLARLIGAVGSRRAALRLVAAGALLGGVATRDGSAATRRRGNRTGRRRGRVRAQAVAQCQPQGCRPGIDCTGKPIGPGTNLARCAFTGEFFFPPANLSLGGANLSRAVFLSVEFFGQPSFRGANASNTCFNGSSLDFADFRGANLRGASFFETDLRGADFRGSNITADQLACATVNCATILPNGKPAVVCDAGQTCCDVCTDTDTDPLNCGTCQHECPFGENCTGGECQCGASQSCTTGLTCCDDQCVDMNTDPNHCGDCTVACGSGQTCEGGSCVGS